jgi:translation initiation factor 3 subunit A
VTFRYVPAELKELFSLMEQEFQPLQLAVKVAPILEYITKAEGLEHYANALKELVLLRLIKQLSQVYTTIKVARLNKLVPFLTPVEIEKFLVDAATGRTLVFRLNHREESIQFGSTLLVASDEDADGGGKLASPQTGVLRGQVRMSAPLRAYVSGGLVCVSVPVWVLCQRVYVCARACATCVSTCAPIRA